MQRHAIRLLYCLAAAFVIICYLCSYDSRTGYTSAICFGDEFKDTRLGEVNALPIETRNNGGYDGQFYAQMALHPSVADPAIRRAMDNPDYRFRRILPSWLAGIAGMGDPWRTLNAYALLNLVFWALTGILLLHWLPPVSFRNFLRWAACLYGVGVIASIQMALLDLPAAFFILLALYLVETRRDHLGALSLAAAVLTKEFSVLAAAMRLDEPKPSRPIILRYALFCGIAVAPFLLWIITLNAHGYSLNAGSPRNFAMPLTGYFAEVREAFAYACRFKLFNLYALIGLTVQIAVLATQFDFRSALWRAAAPFCVLALFLGDAVWEADPGAAYRVLCFTPIAFNILLRENRYFWPLFVAGNLGVLISLHYIVRWI